MTMGSVQENFVMPLRVFFDDPVPAEGSSVELFYKALAEDLCFYSDRCLELAVIEIRTTRKWKTFPSIAECVDACRKIHDQLSAPEIRNAPPKEPYPEWSERRQKRAVEIMTGSVGLPLAVRAMEKGWLLTLWDFCREHERLPNRNEVDRIVTKLKIAARRTIEGGGVTKAMKPLQEAMDRRRDAIAAAVREAQARDTSADRSEEASHVSQG